MEVNSDKLIDQLVNQIKSIRERGCELKNLPIETLCNRVDDSSWNVLECLEHVNRYGDYYLNEIALKIKQTTHPPQAVFKSGCFGNYAAESMLPKSNGKTNWPMKTFPKMDPKGSALSKETIDRFVEQMDNLMDLTERSRQVNLVKTKCKLTIKWLKFSLGDTLRFMVNHNIRHVQQINKILDNLENIHCV